MFKPEQMRDLPPPFTNEEKAKWEAGLRQLWKQITDFAQDSPQHLEAKKKLYEFSRTLHGKIAEVKAAQMTGQNGGQGQQGGPSGARPMGQPQQAQGGDAAQRRPQPQISPKIMEHVSKFPYVVPPHIAPGSPDSAKWIAEAKNKYLKALVAMENGASRVAQLDSILQKRKEEGKPLNAEEEKDYKEKRELASKTNADAKSYVDNFRVSQQNARNALNAQNGGNQQGNQQANQQATNPMNAQTTQPPQRPQLNPQQQSVPNPAMQNTQTVNNAIEAARNQQIGGGRQSIGNGQMGGLPNAQNMQQPGQTQIKTEGGVPQINTAVTQMQANQRPMQNNTNSPQSAVPRSAGPQSATTQQPQIPQALSHSDALGIAARSYSNQAVGTMGHSHPTTSTIPSREPNVMTNKMPISKVLPERATAAPQQVQINQSRPTYTAGMSNAGNGVMGQPVLAKTPGYNLEGEGDHVLSKKKLHELVHQVTGGGQGLGEGEGLTPEVEEVCSFFASDSRSTLHTADFPPRVPFSMHPVQFHYIY